MLLYFFRYSLVGLINTLSHWCFFTFLFFICKLDQASSNLIAFVFSFCIGCFLNLRWTFKFIINLKKIILYFLIMLCISWSIGFFMDCFNLLPIYTLVMSSLSSWFLGFLFSIKFFIGNK